MVVLAHARASSRIDAVQISRKGRKGHNEGGRKDVFGATFHFHHLVSSLSDLQFSFPSRPSRPLRESLMTELHGYGSSLQARPSMWRKYRLSAISYWLLSKKLACAVK